MNTTTALATPTVPTEPPTPSAPAAPKAFAVKTRVRAGGKSGKNFDVYTSGEMVL